MDDDDSSESDDWLDPRRDYPLGPPPPPGKETPEILRRCMWIIWDKRFFKRLQAVGEHEIAELFKHRAPEFNLRHEKGRSYVLGPPKPGEAELRGVLQELIDHVRRCVGSRSPMGPLAPRWSVDSGFVDLRIHPTPIELVGGPRDGAVIDPDVDFDLLRIQDAFDRIDGLTWSLDGCDRACHHVGFRGVYRGQSLWLRVFGGAPPGEKPTVKSDRRFEWLGHSRSHG